MTILLGEIKQETGSLDAGPVVILALTTCATAQNDHAAPGQ